MVVTGLFLYLHFFLALVNGNLLHSLVIFVGVGLTDLLVLLDSVTAVMRQCGAPRTRPAAAFARYSGHICAGLVRATPGEDERHIDCLGQLVQTLIKRFAL